MKFIRNPQELRRWAQYGDAHFIDTGGDAPPPDPLVGQSALKSVETADRALSWYTNQFDTYIKPRQERLDALTTTATNQQLADQSQASAFSREQRQEYKDTYLPVERQSAADAMGYDKQPNIDRRMGIASANVAGAYANARTSAVQELAKYGLNPSSAAFQSTMRRLNQQQALADAGARTGAAFETMDKGIALRAGTAQLGRGLPNTSAQFLAGSTGAGASAMSGAGGSAQVGNQGVSTGGAGYGTAISGYGAAGGMMNQQYGIQTGAATAKSGQMGEMVGTAAGIAAGKIFSSKKVKDRNESLDGDDVLGKVRGLKVDRWAYKGDNQLHIGPYAEELHAKFGVGDGTTIGPTDTGGVALAAVKQLADKMDRMGQRMGISMEEA